MKKLTNKQMGSLGGKATFKKYGKEHFRNLVKKRWDKEKLKETNKI